MDHPSQRLNRFLWAKFGDRYPSARAVITEDNDWISVLHDADSTLPDSEEIYRRIIERDPVCFPHSQSVLYPDFLDRSFGLLDCENENDVVVDPLSSYPTTSQMHQTSVRQQSSESSYDMNLGDVRQALTSQAQDPSSTGSCSRAAHSQGKDNSCNDESREEETPGVQDEPSLASPKIAPQSTSRRKSSIVG
ncbi:hypothetical protein CPC08DRAFT_823791 [Agrocybe pediades]|nr:hypothetical protein CPC08DRAFT_823791 [Agrocybe pediades]